MRICSILLLLSGLFISTSSWITALDVLLYGTDVDSLLFLAPFANAFAQAFFTELGVFFLISLAILALVLAVVNLWNESVSRILRILLLVCFLSTALLIVVGAQSVTTYSNIDAVAQTVFIIGLLTNTVYTVLLFVNAVHTFQD